MNPVYENEWVKLYCGDCLEIMPQLDIKFNCCITDPPYGMIRGLKFNHWNETTVEWDIAINPQHIFDNMSKLIRLNGRIILFSLEPFTSDLITYKSNNIKFCQKAVFIKSIHANPLSCKKSLLKYHEDILIFQKIYDRADNNELRRYFKQIIDYTRVSANTIIKSLGNRMAVHCLYYDDPQFRLCEEKTYAEMVDLFQINKMPGYKPYSELKRISEEYLPRFNLWENGKYKKDIFQYSRDKEHLHPTQKPVELIKDLIKTYTNENDIVLDFTSGSGTTGIACMETNRRCVLVEKEEKYCEITIKRLKDKEKEIAERLF